MAPKLQPYERMVTCQGSQQPGRQAGGCKPLCHSISPRSLATPGSGFNLLSQTCLACSQPACGGHGAARASGADAVLLPAELASYRVGTTSSIFRMSRAASVASDSADVVTCRDAPGRGVAGKRQC